MVRLLILVWLLGSSYTYSHAAQQHTADPILINGVLAITDSTLEDGRYINVHPLEIEAGQPVRIELTSDSLDTYLIVRLPSGEQYENDDWSEGTASRIDFLAEEDTIAEVIATSYAPESIGPYQIRILLGEKVDFQSISDSLSMEDKRSFKGEYYDEYKIELDAGTSVTVQMSAGEFDPYLVLSGPDGKRLTNSGIDGSDAIVQVMPVGDEEWTVIATSRDSQMIGPYTIHIQRASSRVDNVRSYSGELNEGDFQLTKGEYYERYELMFEEHQNVTLTLTSEDFDAFLILQSPSGEIYTNDDFDENTNAKLEVVVTSEERGKWIVYATSLDASKVGHYSLTVSLRYFK